MKRHAFDNLSIRGKMLVSFLAVVLGMEILSAALILVADLRNVRRELVESSVMDARLIAEYSVTPLLFNDREGGASILAKVQAIPSIVSACVYDTAQQIFASHAGTADMPGFRGLVDAVAVRHSFSGSHLLVCAPVRMDNRLYGYVRLVVSTASLWTKMAGHAGVIGLIVVLIAGISIVFAYRLQRIITEPILHLSGLTQRITHEADFTIRIPSARTDEIGTLYRNFDGLLLRIQDRQRERDIAEVALRDSEERNRAMLEALPDLIFMFDRNGIVRSFTGAHAYLYATTETFIGKSISQVMPEEVARLTIEHIDRAMKTGLIQVFEYRLTMNAEVRSFEARMIRSGDEEVLAIVRDITDRRKAEAQLIQAQKMETVGGLASGLAHDFNNVLGAISATVSLMNLTMKRDGVIAAGDLRESIDTISMATHRAAEMVRQLLAFSRPREVSFNPVDLNTTLENARMIGRNSFDKSVILDFRPAPAPAMVNGDATQLEQIVLNLCVNAEHAMTFMKPAGDPRGGALTVTLDRVQADEPFIIAHPHGENGIAYWCLRVSDTGVGMDRRTIQRIFDPFFTTKEKHRGTGLGLAMVYNIVQQHRGFIDVYSEPGHGATFGVYLPATDGIRTCDQVDLVPHIGASRSATVLLIDDEEIIRRAVQKLLATFGYEVVLAADGPAGIALYREQQARIDIVLLDLSMPRMSGKETYLELRMINPAVKVILSSGLRIDTRVDESIAAGVAGFVEKPYSVEVLVREIERVLGQQPV